MLVKISENKLIVQPGLQGLRRELLEAASGYFREFASRRQDDPELRAERVMVQRGWDRSTWTSLPQRRPRRSFAAPSPPRETPVATAPWNAPGLTPTGALPKRSSSLAGQVTGSKAWNRPWRSSPANLPDNRMTSLSERRWPGAWLSGALCTAGWAKSIEKSPIFAQQSACGSRSYATSPMIWTAP